MRYLLASFFISSLSAQNLQPLESKVTVSTSYRYLQYLPEGYAEGAQHYPLILFLHGGGESGSDLELVKKHGIPWEIEQGRELPCIVVAPQNPDKAKLWDDRALSLFLDQRIAELRVDKNRIYLAGMSRGGHGAFMLAVQEPERYAAAVVVCGGGLLAYAGKAKSVPFWFFHGELDPVVPVGESKRLHSALLQAGGTAKLTLYPEVAHEAWKLAFANSALYDWLLAQRLSSTPQTP